MHRPPLNATADGHDRSYGRSPTGGYRRPGRRRGDAGPAPGPAQDIRLDRGRRAQQRGVRAAVVGDKSDRCPSMPEQRTTVPWRAGDGRDARVETLVRSPAGRPTTSRVQQAQAFRFRPRGSAASGWERPRGCRRRRPAEAGEQRHLEVAEPLVGDGEQRRHNERCADRQLRLVAAWPIGPRIAGRLAVY